MGEILELARRPLSALFARLPLWLVCIFMGGGSSQKENPRGNKIAEIMETKSLFLMNDL